LDPFLDISLDIPGGGVALELDGCLKRFTGQERLHAAGYVCGACSGQGDVSKQLSIRVHPVILAIHLKRFEHGALSLKIDTPVVFEEVFSLEPFMAKASTDPRQFEYTLFAVVSHVGGMDSGHYTAHVKRGRDWFGIDDACVSSCTKTEVLKNTGAYMLFYVRNESMSTE
jgi:ubiquitin C-terminal hydrolase